MTPKEKAKELISMFTFLKPPEDDAKFYNPKQCALKCVDEILEGINDANYTVFDKEDYDYFEFKADDIYVRDKKNEFYQEVKQEIEKL